MAWEENSCICLNMQLIAILSRIGVPVIIFTSPFPRPAISSSKYFLRSNIILGYYFRYWYHILHRKNNSFIPKASTINEKTAFIK